MGRAARRKTGLLTVLTAAVVAVSCVVPSIASAALTHAFTGSFCEPSGVGTAPCDPAFGIPAGMTVDPASGDVLVIDLEDKTLNRFKSNGEPSPFSALGSNVIDGVGGEDATPQGKILSTEIANNPIEAQVAVAPPGAASGTAGNIYVTDAFSEVVDIFESTGKYIGQISVGYSCGVAVDAAGTVYVGDYYVGVHELVPTAPATFGAPTTFSYPETCQVAAGAQPTASGGSEGYVFPAKYFGGTAKIDTDTGAEEYSVSAEARMVTVDPETGRLYAAASDRVNEYDVSGSVGPALFSSFSPGAGTEIFGMYSDLAEGLYLSTGGPQVKVFGPPVPLPGVTTEDSTEVTTTTATLNGSVNPNGKQLTECFFEYGTTSAYGQTAPCVPAASSIPADSTKHSVEAEIEGLTAGTAYHVRLVAGTVEGTANGLDRVFDTAIGAPVVNAQAVDVGVSGATVSARINPKGAPTTYRVEYGTTTAYGQSTAERGPIGFGSDDSSHFVNVPIAGLSPGTGYHFRFVATSAAGSDEGDDVSFVTYSPPPSFGPCPNDGFRSGAGARLPDCRAYEQITPIDKHGANAQGKRDLIQASSSGDRVNFFTNGGLPTSGGSAALSPFLATRDSAGWSFDGLLPPTDSGMEPSVIGWDDDFTTTLVVGQGPGGAFGAGIYLRDSDTATFTPGPVGPGDVPFGFFRSPPALAGFAADTSHLIFEAKAQLLPEAAAQETNLYELDDGVLTLAGRVPAGSATSCDDENGPACVTPSQGSFAGPYDIISNTHLNGGGASLRYYTANTISRDGSRVFFTAVGTGQLYVRENGATTTQVSASQRLVPDPNGAKPAAFMAATPDGSTVFFTSCEKLTDDSTAVSTTIAACNTADQGQDLYSYDVESGELTDLTVDASSPKGAAVLGVLGASDDGSYVYFAANGVLAPGASPGNCGVAGGGVCNLYLSHNGVISFVAELTGSTDRENWVPLTGTGDGRYRDSRITPDGRTLLFASSVSQTGYNNNSADCNTVTGCVEFFRYTVADEELICVSCNPTGAAPSGPASLAARQLFLADIPNFAFMTRNLSIDGDRVFFESPDPLVPVDTNGVKDVYEWEAQGSGSCDTEGGCIYILSGGTSPSPSQLADASADGDHVFLFTEQRLVPSDKDRLFDLYDTGVDAGLASQHALAPPTCTGTACQDNPAPPSAETPASSVFSGPGNARQRSKPRKCPKGKRKVRKAGKVTCRKVRKAPKRNVNRGGSK